MKKITLIIISCLVFTGLFAQPLSIELGSVPATSEMQCTGKVWVQVSGGVAPYSFLWNNDANSTFQENLCLGIYSVTVTDASSATATASVEFSTSSQIIIPLEGSTNVNPSLYGQCDGYASINVYGGISPYNYQIFDAESGFLISQASSIENLCTGNYYVVATDANNGTYFCPFTIIDNFIRPVTYQFQGAFPVNQPCSFNVAGEPPFTVNITSFNSAPQSYTIETITGLITYTPVYTEFYEVQLTDNLGNVDQESFCAYEEMNLINITATTPSNGCDGMVMTSNPVDITMNYESSPGIFNTIYIENGTLCPGEYMVMVHDIMCPGVISVYPINVTGPVYDYPVVEVSSANTIYNQCTGMAWLEASGGNAPYEYNWINISNQTDFIDNLCTGNLFVKVTDATNVWSIGYTNIGSDLPETLPGDTLSASQDECITGITDTYIYSYTVNPTNVMVTWAIEHEGTITYLEVAYNYVITLPGVYNVELVLNCQGGKSIVYLVTELDISLTGINTVGVGNVNIFPNPVKDMLNVSFDENVVGLEILSITGSSISQHVANGIFMTFDVSDLSEGVYMIRFTNNDGTSFVKKFVK